MTAITTTILKAVNEIEKNLQDLKVRLFFSSPTRQQKLGIYQEKEVLRTLKQTRKQLWDERYSRDL